MNQPPTPQSGLTLNEWSCMVWILSALGDDRLRNTLYSQALVAVVSARRVGSTQFEVQDEAPRADIADGPLDVRPVAYDESGRPLGTLSLWIENGRLAAMDFGWFADLEPSDFPAACYLRVDR